MIGSIARGLAAAMLLALLMALGGMVDGEQTAAHDAWMSGLAEEGACVLW